MQFVILSPVTLVKSLKNKFSCDYGHYDIVKYHRNVNFEEIDTEPSTTKNDGF